MSHIIIDGYNLLWSSKFFKRYQALELEEQRKMLINHLAKYQKIKSHKITIVFDGTHSGNYSHNQYREGGIDIIFSRHGETADSVMVEIIQNQTKDFIVISSDNFILNNAKKEGYPLLSSEEFARKISEAVISSMMGFDDDLPPDKKPVHKRWITKKKGPSKRLPKSKRRAVKKITDL
jgi:hypothetical protein